MIKMRLIHLLSVTLILVLFAASSLLTFIYTRKPFSALLFGFVNLIGATFPPSPTLIDASNVYIFAAIVVGIVGNIALTILLTSLFYQALSSVSIEEFIAKRKAKAMRNHVILTPINSVSKELANTLLKNKIPFLFIDTDRKAVRKEIRLGFVAIAGDASERSTLLSAGIDRASVLLSLYDEDIKNVFVTISARAANEKCRVISRIKRIEDIQKLQNAGARRIVLPEAAMGEEIANFLVGNY